MRKSLLGVALAIACGCSDRNIEIARQLIQADPNGGPPSVVMIGDCQRYGFAEVDRACVVDSDGKTYGVAGGKLNVTSAAPPYGVYILFVDGATPLAEDLSTSGPDASVQVYAAPDNVEDWPFGAEGDPRYPNQTNRIAARVSLTAEGGLLVTVHDALPIRTQVAVIVDDLKLFRGRINPADGSACTLPPDLELCTMAYGLGNRGFVMRFYVGDGPTIATPDGGTARGAGI